jgi:hypothetical protein
MAIGFSPAGRAGSDSAKGLVCVLAGSADLEGFLAGIHWARLIGPCAGGRSGFSVARRHDFCRAALAWLAVWLVETSRGEHPELSYRRAIGAGLGEFIGILSKFAVGVAIWLTIAVAAFWP